jgi:caffeoyl-CoA O-methyltransferase
MQISPEQGQLLRFLVRALGVHSALEVGVYTGYSGLCVAMELPSDGRWVGCDRNAETAAVAHRHFERAGLGSKFDLRLGDAVATLRQMLREGEAEQFDFVFVDADKENYERYYELALELLRRGGVLALDNVLWGGAVTDPEPADAATLAIKRTNERIQADPRVAMTMLPVGDGLTLACKL